jgi:hypothetical protein
MSWPAASFRLSSLLRRFGGVRESDQGGLQRWWRSLICHLPWTPAGHSTGEPQRGSQVRKTPTTSVRRLDSPKPAATAGTMKPFRIGLSPFRRPARYRTIRQATGKHQPIARFDSNPFGSGRAARASRGRGSVRRFGNHERMHDQRIVIAAARVPKARR